MKKKTAKKPRQKGVKKATSLNEDPLSDSMKAGTTKPHSEGIASERAGHVMFMPPPGALLSEAQEEPNYRDLAEYTDVIATLRDKGFTYRDIADWLSKRGVEVDHNAVYRVYAKSLTEEQAHLESQIQDHEMEEESLRRR